MQSPEDAASTGNTHMTPYLIGLLILLCFGTFCEGYDFFILSLVIKKLGGEFGLASTTLFQTTVAIVNIGAVLGFFLIRLGDRMGRKPVLITSLFGFGALSVVTALSPTDSHAMSVSLLGWHLFTANSSLIFFTVVQFFTKMFLVVEFGTAIIMVSEEMPSARRGTYVAILEVTGGLGGIFAALVHGAVFERWGWRGLYWIGGAPLLLVPVLIFFMKETTHFQQIKAGLNEKRRSLWHIWKTPSKKYLILVGALWFLAYLSYAAVVYTWPTFAAEERGWSENDISIPVAIASVIGMLGYIICGVALDTLGRRKTGMVFFAGSAAALVWTYTAPQALMIPSLVASMFFIFALLPICSTYNAELFPTEMRAGAMAWGNYMMGRPAQVVGPLVIGTVGNIFGSIGTGAAVLAVGPLIAVFVVLFFLPETRGIKLDKVH